MLITKKTEYAIRALIQLGLSNTEAPVQLSHLAQQCGLSVAILEQVFGLLKKSGIVQSTRGAQGGYQFAVPSSKISLIQIIQAVSGPIQLINASMDSDPLSEVWEEARQGVCEQLDRPLTELIQRVQQQKGVANYAI